MKIINDTEYCFEIDSISVEINAEENYIIETFKKFANPEEIKTAKLKFLEFQEKYKITKYLSDLTRFVGASTESIKWVRDYWLPEISIKGIRKIAIIKTKDPYSELALKNVLTPENLKHFEVKSFKTIEEAKTWILENNDK